MNRITEIIQRADQLLTNYAQGYGNTSYIAGEIFPDVVVQKERVRVPEYGLENLRINNTERALRAASNVLEPEGIKLTEIALDEHDLVFPIDYRETETAKALFDLERYAATNVADAMLLKREAMTAAIVQNPANYPSGSKTTLSGNSKWSDYTIVDDRPVSTPIDDVFAARDNVRSKTGRYPNIMVLGATTYRILQNHPQIMERIKYSQNGVATVELLQTIFNIPKIVIGESVSADRTTNQFVDVWGDNCILAHVAQTARPQRSQFVPSFGYSLILNAFPVLDKYSDIGQKINYIRATTLMKPALLAPNAGYLFTDCV